MWSSWVPLWTHTHMQSVSVHMHTVAVELVPQPPRLCCSVSLVVWHVAPLHAVNSEHRRTWCVWCVWLQMKAQPSPTQTPKPSNSDVSSLFPLSSFLLPLYRFPAHPSPSCSLPLLPTSLAPLHPTCLLPLCPTACLLSTGALDSVVVSSLWHNLRLLGGAGPPVALQGRHSVPAHYRHNLLLSPVSKPRQQPP